jgi:membrane-bound metal-dependent hydrolase YbcI (DUF457 family)
VHNAYPFLGAALLVGGITHLLGDMITSHGCPAFWPLPMDRETWHCIGVPDDVSVKVGGKVEVYVLRTLFFAICVASGIALSGSWFADQVDRLRT